MKKGAIHRKRKIKDQDPEARKKKIEMYRAKLQDENYIEYAIQRIAMDLTIMLTK